MFDQTHLNPTQPERQSLGIRDSCCCNKYHRSFQVSLHAHLIVENASLTSTAMRRRRQNPFIDTIHGPIPPRHPRKRAGQMVWPRDQNSSTMGTWSRLKDVFTGKGPDIWCTRRGSLGPNRPVWSNWRSRDPYPPPWDNLGYYYDDKGDRPAWLYAGRPDDVRYDFRTRRYRVPDDQVWSDAKYDRNNNEMYHRTARFGRHAWEDRWHDPEHPDRHPFNYYPDTAGWNGDEVPLF